MKRTVHTNLGDFYLKYYDGKECELYKVSYFYSKQIISKFSYRDIDDLKKKIKENLDYQYRAELRKLKDKSDFSNWNGYIDKQTERDDKINQIV